MEEMYATKGKEVNAIKYVKNNTISRIYKPVYKVKYIYPNIAMIYALNI